MKPGDLVNLKYQTHYCGVDLADNVYLEVPEGSIGVFIGRGLDSYGRQIEMFLTHGRMVGCDPGVWMVIDETR